MPVTTYTYKSIRDFELMADVCRPPDTVPRPVVLYLHGGGLMLGRRDGANPLFVDRLLKEGYVHISIDYRLAPETKLDAIIQDVRDAVAWVREQGGPLFHANPARIAIAGGSAGGYLALLAGTAVSPPPQALVSFYGYGDIIDKWDDGDDAAAATPPSGAREQDVRAAVSGPPIANSEHFDPARIAFFEYCRDTRLWTREVTGLDPKKDRDSLRAYCPLWNLTKEFPPSMLLHGDRDQAVPVSQSIRMAQALKNLGVEHELIIVPGADHGFDYGNNHNAPMIDRDAIFDRVMAFLRKNLAGATG